MKPPVVLVACYVDGRAMRMVTPRARDAIQRLQATLVQDQQDAIRLLVRLVDQHQPGFIGVVNRLSRPTKGDRATISALRRATRTAAQIDDILENK